jgi:hypothetical protein
MRFLKRFLARLTNFATRRQIDQRLREEIEQHLALRTAENLRAGKYVSERRASSSDISSGKFRHGGYGRTGTRAGAIGQSGDSCLWG